MKNRFALSLALIALCAAARIVSAIDVAWMQPGVRVWYFGGVGTGVGGTADAEEAHLFGTVTGSSVPVTHHSAITHWTLPKPTETQTYSVLDQGPCWIHPQVLQTIHQGDHWMGFDIVTVDRSPYTWATFPHNLLPANALFDLQPQREFVKLTYMIPGFSFGSAYFDSDTGILLYYDTFWGEAAFFVLAEINYDFGQHAAFAEDRGPHAGFHSWVSEASLGNPIGVGGGLVDIHSQVESRYGPNVEMWVNTTLTGPSNFKPTTYENYAFFGGVPILRRIDHDQAGSVRPEQWNAFGQYLWWWLPESATQSKAAGRLEGASAISTINVFDVPMDRTSDQPLTYTATQSPQRFYFSSLAFGSDGYMSVFSAKDPTLGLDVKPGDFNFQNHTVTDGPAYYRANMIDDDFPPAGQVPGGWTVAPEANAGWLVAGDYRYEGPYSLKSAPVGNGQAAAIQATGIYSAGNVQFAARVSSEQNHDYFEFYVDDALKVYGSGNIDWTLLSVPVTAGNHTFTWAYAKDAGGSAGTDAAWIDLVVLPPIATLAVLTVDLHGSGTGTVASNLAGIACPGDCAESYVAGTEVVLTATPTGGSMFTGWLGGGCTGMNATCIVTLDAATTISATFASAGTVAALDIDLSTTGTRFDALTDGLLIIRYLSGSSGGALTNGALGGTAVRTSPTVIGDYLADIKPLLDVDGDGKADGVTDGLLIMRYLFGLRGDALIADALGPLATRTTAGAIEAYIQNLLP